jgi:hypothetical protein
MRYSFYVWEGDVPTSLEHCLVIQHRIDEENRGHREPPPTPTLAAFIERVRKEWPWDGDAFEDSPWKDCDPHEWAHGRRWRMPFLAGVVHETIPRTIELAEEFGLTWWDPMIEPRMSGPNIWEVRGLTPKEPAWD